MARCIIRCVQCDQQVWVEVAFAFNIEEDHAKLDIVDCIYDHVCRTLDEELAELLA